MLVDIETISAQWNSQPVFRYIEGTTPKIDLFQFLCMASRTNLYPSFFLSHFWQLFHIFLSFSLQENCRQRYTSHIRPFEAWCTAKSTQLHFIVWQRAHNSTINGSELIMDLIQIATYVWQGYGSLTYCRSGYEGCQVPKYQHAVVDITPNLKIAVHRYFSKCRHSFYGKFISGLGMFKG